MINDEAVMEAGGKHKAGIAKVEGAGGGLVGCDL